MRPAEIRAIGLRDGEACRFRAKICPASFHWVFTLFLFLFPFVCQWGSATSSLKVFQLHQKPFCSNKKCKTLQQQCQDCLASPQKSSCNGSVSICSVKFCRSKFTETGKSSSKNWKLAESDGNWAAFHSKMRQQDGSSAAMQASWVRKQC